MPDRRRILVVEDDPAARAALFQLLTEAGYSVLTADDGQQALDLVMRGVRPRVTAIQGKSQVVADAVFHKPYEPLDLLDAIKRLAPPGSF